MQRKESGGDNNRETSRELNEFDEKWQHPPDFRCSIIFKIVHNPRLVRKVYHIIGGFFIPKKTKTTLSGGFCFF